MSKENDYIMETRELSEQIILNEINYNCTECSSPIEIFSINEIEFTLEFKCINNNHKAKMPIKEYIDKMKDFNDKNNNKDICIIKDHNQNIFECYCFDCKKHLCKECLKTRNHIGHNKTNIIEIQPNHKEIKIMKKYYSKLRR